ncbi:MAG: DUF2163 domain-containing protein [Ilumatobacteraceae bacterium]
MALFVKVTPRSIYAKPTMDPVGFTTNTRDMTLPGHSGISFKSAAGMIPSEMGQSFGETAVMEFQGMYATGIFTAEDVVAGVWNDAKVEIFASPWDDVNLGELVMFTGNLAEFEHYGDYFKAEIRGLSARLSQDTGPVTSRNCRVKFRSTECGFAGSTITINSVSYPIELTQAKFVSIIKNPVEILIIGDPVPNFPANFFQNGTLKIGQIVREIATSSTVTDAIVTLQLKRPLPFVPDFEQEVILTRGCNKRVEDCRAYNNIANFRGEPYVPGLETINRVPPPTTEII